MATKKAKVENMSEVRESDTENGWKTFTLHSTDDDFDIVCRVNTDYFEGCAPESVFRMAQTKYTHVIGQEAASAMASRDKDKYPDGEAFQRTWRLNKRQAIVSGEYAEGNRGGPRGPRLSEFDQVLRDLIDTEKLLPLMQGNPLPKSGKTVISGQTLDYWREYCKNKYTDLHDKARAIVAQRKAAVDAVKANSTGETDFAAALA